MRQPSANALMMTSPKTSHNAGPSNTPTTQLVPTIGNGSISDPLWLFTILALFPIVHYYYYLSYLLVVDFVVTAAADYSPIVSVVAVVIVIAAFVDEVK